LSDFGDHVERRAPPIHRNHAALLVKVTKICVRCDAFPCLGETDCKHEKALRQWKECPQGKWFYA
jgi:hypothetical protein